ncbi:MAG: L-2-amino-thiazoline-4-carboxylic acid hydrolase, partial [Actinomycetota bacterium]|nr:L-2-amino-thiazoline-4-carboxylic acid hydrolase [Actinomycetota bacterium]
FDFGQCRFVQLTPPLGRAHHATMFGAADSDFFAREGAPVRLERTGTLATGAPRCDFRFHYT